LFASPQDHQAEDDQNVEPRHQPALLWLIGLAQRWGLAPTAQGRVLAPSTQRWVLAPSAQRWGLAPIAQRWGLAPTTQGHALTGNSASNCW